MVYGCSEAMEKAVDKANVDIRKKDDGTEAETATKYMLDMKSRFYNLKAKWSCVLWLVVSSVPVLLILSQDKKPWFQPYLSKVKIQRPHSLRRGRLISIVADQHSCANYLCLRIAMALNKLTVLYDPVHFLPTKAEYYHLHGRYCKLYYQMHLKVKNLHKMLQV